MMQERFFGLADHVMGALAPGEDATLRYQGERSDFVRFNHGRVRQPGTVEQHVATLRLLRGRRHVSVELSLSGQGDEDRARLDAALQELRARVGFLPEDPFLMWSDSDRTEITEAPDQLPDAPAMVEAVVEAAHGLDLVGFLARGPIYQGFASSRGQRSWFGSSRYSLDWCLYHQADKAVKSMLAGFSWDRAALDAKIDTGRAMLAALARPSRAIPPGGYRALLAPEAVASLWETVAGWQGFSKRALQTCTSPLLKMVDGGATLHPGVQLSERPSEGGAPTFQEDGFLRPEVVPLIVDGRLQSPLVSPRSAQEYGVPTNGATSEETPCALVMEGGDLPDEAALARLGTGIWIGNLWYINFSDRPACRMTGMTRFATFWVENGEIVAPLSVMRFDDTIYRMLGSELEGLTRSAAFLPSTDTYFQRSTDSMRMPGALLRELMLTL